MVSLRLNIVIHIVEESLIEVFNFLYSLSYILFFLKFNSFDDVDVIEHLIYYVLVSLTFFNMAFTFRAFFKLNHPIVFFSSHPLVQIIHLERMPAVDHHKSCIWQLLIPKEQFKSFIGWITFSADLRAFVST